MDFKRWIKSVRMRRRRKMASDVRRRINESLGMRPQSIFVDWDGNRKERST
jgi:hypothetical protein